MTKAERELLVLIAETYLEQRVSGVPLFCPWEQKDFKKLIKTIKKKKDKL